MLSLFAALVVSNSVPVYISSQSMPNTNMQQCWQIKRGCFNKGDKLTVEFVVNKRLQNCTGILNSKNGSLIILNTAKGAYTIHIKTITSITK